MVGQTESEQRRVTFDQDALLYDRMRPGYPDALFEDIIAFSHLPIGGRILEVGCGTGQATLPFARRGYRITCIELGANLAAVAREKLRAYPGVEVIVDTFERWPVEGAFDLLISATAFHWVDPAIRYQRAARALKPGGTIALFWNRHVGTEISAPFFTAVQEVYRREAPEMMDPPPTLLHPDEVSAPVGEELERSADFEGLTIRRYRWEISYDSESYIKLLNTYSPHRRLESGKRERLFKGITELINTRFGGQIIQEHVALLYLARRK